MTNPPFTNAPQSYARTAGILGLFIVVAGIFAEGFVRGSLIVSGDAAATASNIMASETLFRSALAGEIVMLCADIGMAWVLYVLLKPVNRNLALFAAFFRLTLAAISGVNALNLLGALLILSAPEYLSVFTTDQLNALALMALKTHTLGYHIALIFFSMHLALLSYLIVKSTYLPRILGIMLAIAAICYLGNSLTAIVAPPMARGLFPWIMLPPLVAELSYTLWLLIKGVNTEKWDARVAEIG